MSSHVIFSRLTLLSVSTNRLHLFCDLTCIHLPALDSVALTLLLDPATVLYSITLLSFYAEPGSFHLFMSVAHT